MADLRAPRGMHDVLPEDQPLWRLVRETAARVASLFGYEEITLPIVENASVFQRTSGGDSDIVAKEMYLFEDRGGERVALRPEGTAGVCRAYLEHGMASRPQPVRLWYLGPFFRYDRPQAGRYRQLWQFGVENIGDASPAADVEVIELQQMLYRELGLGELVLRINSIGTAETRREYAEALQAHLAPRRDSLSPDSQRRLETNVLRILDSKEDADRTAVADAPSILDHLTEEDAEHFARVKGYLDDLGIAYVVDPLIVRGLDYYSRTVWEFEPVEAGGQSTVGAGGRYDGLMELLGGQPTPGVGFATGIERIVMNLQQRKSADARGVPAYAPAIDFFLVVASRAAWGRAARMAAELRRGGHSVVIGDPENSVKRQLRSATRVGARFSEVVGDRELESSLVRVRDLVASTDLEEPTPFEAYAHDVLLSWRRLEGLLADIAGAAAIESPVRREPILLSLRRARALLDEQGWLSLDEFERLEQLRQVRNLVAHGHSVPASSERAARDFKYLAEGLAASLIARLRDRQHDPS